MAHALDLPTPAVASYRAGQRDAISSQLKEVAWHFPDRTREFADIAARAVAECYCTHDGAPSPLPAFSERSEAQQAAKGHPGLCGVHHASTIAGVSVQEVLVRDHQATANKLRNQVRYADERYHSTYVVPSSIRTFTCSLQ